MSPKVGTGGQKSIVQSGQTASSKHASSPNNKVKGSSEARPSGQVKTRVE